MDSFELNKIIAAVLMVALLVIGIGKLSNIIFHVEKPKTPGYAVEVQQATTVSSSVETAVVEKIDIAALMAMGDIAAGEKVFKKCAACHSIIKGGKNNIGPALWNVVGRKTGAVTDYKYSKALASFDKEWTFEELNGYLIKHAKWIKGTKMAVAGFSRPHPSPLAPRTATARPLALVQQMLLIRTAGNGRGSLRRRHPRALLHVGRVIKLHARCALQLGLHAATLN